MIQAQPLPTQSFSAPSILKPELTQEQLQRELDYRAALHVLRRLCEESLLSQAEARKIKQKIAAEFSPVWAGIADK